MRILIKDTDGNYAGGPHYTGAPWSPMQSHGHDFSDETPEHRRELAKLWNAKAVRLLSRSEAVERASRAAYMRALEDVASMLDRCAQTQDHAAWEAAQAGLTALVAKHETVAGSYRLAARSAREMGR